VRIIYLQYLYILEVYNNNKISLRFLNVITRVDGMNNIYDLSVVALKIVDHFKNNSLKYNTF